MRLFVAVDLDADTRARLPAIRAALLAEVAAAPVPPRITWVADASAHVTLRFLGDCDEPLGQAIADAIARGFVRPAFDVRWDHLGTFPGGRHPRAIWLGPSAGRSELVDLAQCVDERLSPLIGAREERPFAPHVTIGRVKERGRQVDWPRAIAKVPVTASTTHVARITLYASRLSPKGPTYTGLSSGSLVGGR